MKNIFKIENRIYITSDEEIKEGDWYYLLKEDKIAKCPKILNLFSVTPEWTQKIILTTDADLVADGIQYINFETLQWLVENPSCEYVKVIEIFDCAYVGGFLATETKVGYEIIIPKDRTTTPEIKKETIEEAAERYEETDFYTTPTVETSQMMIQRAFINGAKWQAERMYTEEDIKKSFEAGRKGYMRGSILNKEYFFTWKSFKLWFEQFKKK
jgi:hypothetical protein